MRHPCGIYIHIPFCVSKCPYCDFYSVQYSDNAADNYTDAVLRAIRTQPFGRLSADTLYFGGGTPLLIGAKRLGKIIDTAKKAFAMDDTAEITVEANPSSAMKAELSELKRRGANRISFGVQSLNDTELQSLGRLHNADQAKAAITDAADAGFAQISADLMLGIPHQTVHSLEQSIETLSTLPLDHISAYLLKLEEGTRFWAQKDTLDIPDEDGQADFYLRCVQLLEQRGFAQYEISNFAKAQKYSRHNLKYWRCQEYLGIGPAAHSFIAGKRFYFESDLQSFIRTKNPFELAIQDGSGGDMEEKIMLALRLSEGFNLNEAPKETADILLRKAQFLAGQGLVKIKGESISLTTQGFLLSNSIIAALLSDCST